MRPGVNALEALRALRADPAAAVVQAVSSAWAVAVLVGLFSPVQGFKQETEALLDRSSPLFEQYGLVGVDQGWLEEHVAWRRDHAAKWDRGLTFIAVVCVGLGGLGTLNIGLSQLKDRTRELAIRKACGASNADIRAQVLVEGTITSALGGLLGAGLGLALAKVGAGLIEIPYAVSPKIVALGLCAALVTGLLAALWPAWRAARHAPIEALREL